jgi:1-deoxyxylulose-5-phosphate synthase
MAPSPRFAPRRTLGRTGFIATALGVGDVADRSIPLETCVRTVERALDFGLNLIDTAPNYEDGYSEQIVGAALRERRRDSIFLIDKIDNLSEPVAPQVGGSLDRLGLPAVDLFVFHAVSTVEAWEALMVPGGPFDQLAACVRRGQARFRGVSSHHPDVLARAIPSGLCDVVMFPIGPFVHPRYASEILPLARAHGVGSVCFKTFGAGKLLGDTRGYNQPLDGAVRHAPATPLLPRLTVAECVRYTLTVDPDVALLGMSSPEEQDPALAAAEAFQMLSPAELTAIAQRAAVAVQGKGACHWDPPVA